MKLETKCEKMCDEAMMKRIDALWNNGYDVELMYFGNRCVDSFKKGLRRGRAINCLTKVAIAVPLIFVGRKVIDIIDDLKEEEIDKEITIDLEEEN